MSLSRPILKALTEMKFINPTAIQSAAIPVALAGKDICGGAVTGFCFSYLAEWDQSPADDATHDP